MIEICKYIL